MSPSPSPSTKHIPAWRKLGLKLKNAKENIEATSEPSNGISSKERSNGKRKFVAEGEASEPAPSTNGHSRKKKKTQSPSLDNDSTNSVSQSAGSTDPTPHIPATPSLQRKKSVTFAPEAKAQDGDSVKQYYKKWVSGQQKDDPGFDASTLNPALKSIEPAPAVTHATTKQLAAPLTHDSLPADGKSTTPTKAKKKKSKPTSELLQSPSSTNNGSSPIYVHPALTYLTAHHNSPSTWKFNKAHQNYLVKHLFHHNLIPSKYDPALASYLKGLASENTKARIRREALEIRADDEKWLASPDAEPQSTANSNEDKKDDDEDNNDKTTKMGVDRETPEQTLARRLTDYNAAVDKIKAILEAKEDAREAAEWDDPGSPVRQEWEARLLRRRRAEVVLWGVGEVGEKVMEALSVAVTKQQGQQQQQQQQQEQEPKPFGKGTEQPEFRKQMGPKRIKFGDEDEKNVSIPADTTTATPITYGIKSPPPSQPPRQSTAAAASNGTMAEKRKRKRKRNYKDRQGAIPDDISTSNSSSSDNNSSDDEETKRVMQRKRDLQERLAAQKRELERARREVEEEISEGSDEGSEGGSESGSEGGSEEGSD